MWKGSKFPPRKWQKEALPLIIDSLRAGKKPIVSAIMGSGKSILLAELCYIALRKLKQQCCVVVSAPRQSLVEQLTRTIGERCGLANVGSYFTHQKKAGSNIIVCCNASAGALSLKLKELGREVAMLIFDEVHSSESTNFKLAWGVLKPACAVGFTATPFRSSDRESLSLWDEVVYRYTAGDALADKVIVPWNLVHWNGTGADAAEVNKICLRMMMPMEGPGIASALSIEDAEEFAEFLNSQGFPSMAIHSKMHRSKRESIIRKLEAEEIRCVVHVSLLSEGVDMPWLRWLCLRRPVQARVRFVQEVGRALRSHPGKTEAFILDPHDLFSVHGLTYPEALGEMLVQKTEEEEELASLELDEEQEKQVREMRPAQAVTAVGSWLRGIQSVMRSAGLMRPASDEYDGWRDGEPSMRQIEALDRLSWASRYIPQPARDQFKMLVVPERALCLKRGDISDMLDILVAVAEASKDLRKNHKYWHWPASAPIPETVLPMQGLVFAMERA
tara:strand:+ start:7247 stop:8755 length:1509 start_codon:yes stop_codon:yes gene_type:complete